VPRFYDTATADYTNHTGSPYYMTDFDCGEYEYEILYSDGSAIEVSK